MIKSWLLASTLVLVPLAASASPAKTGAKATQHHVFQPKVTAEAARKIALAKVPGATVKSEELEKEHGKLVYSFDLAVHGKTGIDEVLVDAITGKVLSVVHETPKQEAREKELEKKEAKKPGHP